MSFRRGDHVVLPRYGVGKVVASEERPVFGRRQRCLQIKFSGDNRTVYIQEEEFHRVHLRQVMEKRVLKGVWQVLKEPNAYTAIRGTRRRLERYRQKSVIADPFSLAEVVRDLMGRSRNHRLTDAESTLAESAVELLAAEIAHIENKKPQTVRKRIDRVVAAAGA